jgi:hypothetical protein
MRVSTHFAASLVSLLAISLAAAGCTDSKRSGSGKNLSTGTGAVNSGSVLAAVQNGTLPGIPGLEGLAESLREGPGVQITSPTRAAYMPAGPTQLMATVVKNGRPLTEVKVNGQLVTPDPATGEVSAPVTLVPGVNTLVVEAWDDRNKYTKRHVSVLAGDFLPEADMIGESSAVRITDDGLDLLEPGMTQGLEAQRQSLISQVLGASYGKNTSAKGFSFGTISAEIDAVPGGINFQVDVTDLALDFEVKIKILFLFTKRKRGTIRAQRLTVQGFAELQLDANGQLTSTVKNVKSSVAGFSVPSFASKYEGKIRAAFVDGFKAQGAAEAKKAIDAALTGAPTSGSTQQTLLGQQIQNDWKLSTLTFDDWGVTAVFGGNVRAATPMVGTENRSWALKTPVSDLVGGGPGWNGAVAIHQDAINQATHAAWRSGAMDFTLDSTTYAQLMPGAPAIDSTALIAMAPMLSIVVPPALPLEMQISAAMPPVVRVRPNAPNLLDLTLPSIRVHAQLNDVAAGTSVDLGDSVFTIETSVSVVEQNGTLRLVPTVGQTRIFVDVEGAALPGTEQLLEKLSGTLAQPLLQAALANTAGLPIPKFQGARMGGLKFMAHKDSLVGAGVVTSIP